MSSCSETTSSEAFIVSLASASVMLFTLVSNARPDGPRWRVRNTSEFAPEGGVKLYM